MFCGLPPGALTMRTLLVKPHFTLEPVGAMQLAGSSIESLSVTPAFGASSTAGCVHIAFSGWPIAPWPAQLHGADQVPFDGSTGSVSSITIGPL